MDRALIATLLVGLAMPASAGEIHGKVTAKGVKDSADAVVYVAAVAGKTFAPPKDHVRIDQRNMLFVPRVMPVLVGTTVDFLNSDAQQHNVYSPDACASKFNLGTWPKGEVRSYVFKNECAARLLCMVHPEMAGFVVAVPTPFYAVTRADGSYRIPDLPEGSYIVKVWHPRLKPTEKTVTVSSSLQAVDFEIAR